VFAVNVNPDYSNSFISAINGPRKASRSFGFLSSLNPLKMIGKGFESTQFTAWLNIGQKHAMANHFI